MIGDNLVVVLVIILSFILKSSADKPYFYNIRYDDICEGQNSCAKVFEVKEEVTGPVFLYIYYEDFFINHRNVVRSVSRRQIAGEDVADSEIDKRCPGFRNNKDKPALVSFSGASLVETETLSPCGIYPSLLPLDAFKLVLRDTNADKVATGALPGDTDIVITTKEKMNWEGLKGSRFKQHASATTKQWVDVEQGKAKVNYSYKLERFIEWMKSPVGSNFSVLVGVVPGNLKAGNYVVNVVNGRYCLHCTNRFRLGSFKVQNQKRITASYDQLARREEPILFHNFFLVGNFPSLTWSVSDLRLQEQQT